MSLQELLAAWLQRLIFWSEFLGSHTASQGDRANFTDGATNGIAATQLPRFFAELRKAMEGTKCHADTAHKNIREELAAEALELVQLDSKTGLPQMQQVLVQTLVQVGLLLLQVQQWLQVWVQVWVQQ